jgi:hypothetical protein
MRILHIQYTDNIARGGGGVVAMYRLHRGLKSIGVESKILCKVKRPDSSDSVEIPSSRWIRKIESQLSRFTLKCGLNDLHCVSSFGILRDKTYQAADVLNFHGIHGGFFSYLVNLLFIRFMTCGPLLDIVPTATTAIAGRVVAENVRI